MGRCSARETVSSHVMTRRDVLATPDPGDGVRRRRCAFPGRSGSIRIDRRQNELIPFRTRVALLWQDRDALAIAAACGRPPRYPVLFALENPSASFKHTSAS